MKKIKTAKGRKASSTRWIERQLNDPYVTKAQKDGYRSRAAYKLLEMDEKHKFLKSGMLVVDLGAAPGGWCQIALEKGCKKIVAIDLLEMDELPGVIFMQQDFMADDAPQKLKDALGGKADVVLSDMAHNTTGHKNTDHLKIMGLVEAGYDFATQILKQDGSFLAKTFQGGAESELLARIKIDFKTVRHLKPPASRSDSSEKYLLATGFRKQASDE
ncbi:MAG: RlmE family RNA methyltransferase [Alphaproteobacteria bacterium]|jgi:23S rRNA (uridine2552-2'-O)-methyltransferase|nr:RlmE family RNA methyltransferase [Alphaproteobacteria bacterium]MCB1550472.1 RlmE family RNA methyltransferase [Alphaproteobacteria bacterium]MCB9985967.1 RlmE family RNA methyltransferase [Micavibrio sp.]HPQ50408.1 RlmE family RNA methyltransferase [Alphaproteobacteria bacterium]HRK96878.1 RlmE family RNA methyltransferase [Alphaproteobacteria bacterium]